MFVLRGVDYVAKNVVEMNHPLLVYNTAVFLGSGGGICNE